MLEGGRVFMSADSFSGLVLATVAPLAGQRETLENVREVTSSGPTRKINKSDRNVLT